jgi:RNA polymerase sigma-70 factor (ECF subfamily)
VPIFEDNRALLDSYRRGDRAALTTVYSRYVDEVAALVRRGFRLDTAGVTIPGVREPQKQLDLIQEVFVRAFAERARLAYDGLSPFRPWLLRIAKNLMIDEGRRSGRVVAFDDAAQAALENDEPALLVSPEDELASKRLREAAAAFRAGLAQAHQRFVQLRFENELSQADVAQALNVSRRQVRTLEQELRLQLRRFLKEKGLIPP